MSYGILTVLIYLYAAVKGCVSCLKIIKGKNNIIILLSIIISVLLLVPIILIVLILVLFRTLINLYLQKLHKEYYMGLMKGIDAICCSQENCVSAMWVFVEFNGRFEELKQNIIKQIKIIMTTKHQKVFYSRGEFMGYHYYFREDITAENYITIMKTNDDFIDKRKISQMFIPYNKSPMPCNDRKLLQIVICPKPVHLEEYPGAKIYSIIYRIHHCMGDATSCVNWLLVAADNDGRVIIPRPEIITSNKHSDSKLKVIKEFLTNVSIKNFPMAFSDRNCLRGYKLTEDKYTVWFSDTGTAYMDKIRNLRKKINGAKFLDIMNTCLTSSLYDYYKKRGLPIPKNIIGGVVFGIPTTNCPSDFEMTNSFSTACFTLPINPDSSESNKLMARFISINEEYEIIKKSFDIHFNYFCAQNIASILPSQVIRFMSQFIEITIGISSLPGCDTVTLFDGGEVKDLLIIAPNSPGTGLHIVFHTYKGHFRVVLTADVSVTPKYEDAQEIVDGIILNLDRISAMHQ